MACEESGVSCLGGCVGTGVSGFSLSGRRERDLTWEAPMFAVSLVKSVLITLVAVLGRVTGHVLAVNLYSVCTAALGNLSAVACLSTAVMSSEIFLLLLLACMSTVTFSGREKSGGIELSLHYALVNSVLIS